MVTRWRRERERKEDLRAQRVRVESTKRLIRGMGRGRVGQVDRDEQEERGNKQGKQKES